MVWAIIVYAVQLRTPKWTRPDILDEMLKGAPTLADPNPARTVVLVVTIGRVGASFPHLTPCAVFALKVFPKPSSGFCLMAA